MKKIIILAIAVFLTLTFSLAHAKEKGPFWAGWVVVNFETNELAIFYPLIGSSGAIFNGSKHHGYKLIGKKDADGRIHFDISDKKYRSFAFSELIIFEGNIYGTTTRKGCEYVMLGSASGSLKLTIEGVYGNVEHISPLDIVGLYGEKACRELGPGIRASGDPLKRKK